MIWIKCSHTHAAGRISEDYFLVCEDGRSMPQHTREIIAEDLFWNWKRKTCYREAEIRSKWEYIKSPPRVWIDKKLKDLKYKQENIHNLIKVLKRL